MSKHQTRSHLKSVGASLVCAFSLFAAPAFAFVTYSGLDLNATDGSGASTPLASTPNSSAAEALFKSGLVGVGTETFESITPGATASLGLVFPGAGTATLTTSTPGAGVASVTPGSTDGAGRYSVPSATSSRYWITAAGPTFAIDFDNPGGVAAFGFYGIDIGDFGGSLGLSLTLSGGGMVAFAVPTSGTTNQLDGSVLFFGVVAGGSSELFTRVSFTSTAGADDFFGFDNMTVGSLEQTQGRVSEPGTLAMLGIAIAALGLTGRRRGRR